jgi:hypothetical protein
MIRAAVLVGAIGLAGCVEAPEADVGTDRQHAMTWNAMTWNAMTWNAMTWNALSNTDHGNHEMPGWALSTETFFSGDGDPEYPPDPADGTPGDFFEVAFQSPAAVEFTSYVVNCALPAGEILYGPNVREPEKPFVFEGGVGLAPDWGWVDSWNPDDRVSLYHQELVTACLIDRLNARKISVPMSIRGLDIGWAPIPLADEVRGSEHATLGTAQFESCPGKIKGDRECGWDPEFYVGTCTAGERITVTSTECTGAGVMIRVCPGIGACTRAERIIGRGNICANPRSFRCPESGDFAIMTTTFRSWREGKATLEVKNASFPTSEMELFDWREGAGYGNLFLGTLYKGALNRDGTVDWVDRVTGLPFNPATDATPPGKAVYDQLYACHDPWWNAASADYLDRVCFTPPGGRGPQCAALVTGDCSKQCLTSDTRQRKGDGDYGGCRDKLGKRWYHPLTVFLNHPCDSLPWTGTCGGQ